VSQVVADGDHTCALLNHGTVKCWGWNAAGQLGQGDTTTRGDGAGEMGDNLLPIDLGMGRTAAALAAGASYTCAILDHGVVKCWGANGGGQLGQGDTTTRGDGPGEMGDSLLPIDLGTGRTAVALAAGDAYNCVLLDNGTVKCWGYGLFGQLGQGDTSNRGDGPGEMGDSLLPIDLGTGRTAVALAAGSLHTCAILDNGTVKCWGWNYYGQLGQGDANDRGDGPGQMGDNLLPVDLGTGRTAVALAVGSLHTCAVLDDGMVKCWGANAYGRLGQGDSNNRGSGPGEMGDNLLPIDLGIGRMVVVLVAGWGHTCASLDNGMVKCWGYNFAGELGQGDTNNRGSGPGEMGDNLLPIDLGTGRTAVAFAAGYNYSCALLDDTTVKCWGWNGEGDLGYGDTTNRGDGPGEMGDNLPTIAL
jgi:alpha-tubulin suppressor-like RCC1 family protein